MWTDVQEVADDGLLQLPCYYIAKQSNEDEEKSLQTSIRQQVEMYKSTVTSPRKSFAAVKTEHGLHTH